jgi:hypothetical protein
VRDDQAVGDLAARVDVLDVVTLCARRLVRWEEYKPDVFMDIVGNLRPANASVRI